MSQLNPSEISSVLKDKIAGLDLSAERKNEGIIVSVSDGIVRIHGMGDVMYGEVIEFENEKLEIMDHFIDQNKDNFNNEDLKFSSKIKK